MSFLRTRLLLLLFARFPFFMQKNGTLVSPDVEENTSVQVD